MSIIYLQRNDSPFEFGEISEEQGKSLCELGYLCQELVLNRALLAKHKRFNHGLLRLPPEIIFNHMLPYCRGDYIRVIGLTSVEWVRWGKRSDTIMTFFRANLKDICQYIGRRTSCAPHTLNVGLVEEDNVRYLSPYKEKVNIPKRCKIFIWKTHAFPIKGCKCPFTGTDRCKCHIQEYDWTPWIEKYKWLS